jgi:hypothetical protein
MKIGWDKLTGLAVAGLLVASPAYAGGDKAHQRAGAEQDPAAAGTAAGTESGAMGATGAEAGAAQTEAQTEAHAGAQAGLAQNEVTGKVERFDEQSRQLTLSLPVSETAQVMKDGQQAELGDIQEGDEIRASFTGTGETLEVNRIEVISNGAGEATPTPMGTGAEQPQGTGTGTMEPGTGTVGGGAEGGGYGTGGTGTTTGR